MRQSLILAALVLGYVALGAANYYQQIALNVMLENERALVQDLRTLSSDIQRLRREQNGFPGRVEKIELQMDLVTAATRAGWGQAYKMVRAGVFEAE